MSARLTLKFEINIGLKNLPPMGFIPSMPWNKFWARNFWNWYLNAPNTYYWFLELSSLGPNASWM
jgi:hypothetical protein